MKKAELKNQLVTACGNQGLIVEAPLVVVACGYDIHYNMGGYMGDRGMVMDVTIAFAHLVLTAMAEGLHRLVRLLQQRRGQKDIEQT